MNINGYLLMIVIITTTIATFDDEMRWGTYKPQLIHAVSQRNIKTYNPITYALMYYDQLADIKSIIYKVPELDTQSIKFNILNHNGRNLNVQEIKDPFRDCKITTSWAKFPIESKLNWVDETVLDKSSKSITLVQAYTIEQFSPSFNEHRTFNVSLQNNSITISTPSEDGVLIERFFITVTLNDTILNPPDSMNIRILKLNQEYSKNWDARTAIYQKLINKSDDSDVSDAGYNLIAIIITVPPQLKLVIQVIQADKFIPQFQFKDFQQLIGALQNRDKFQFKQAYKTDSSCAQASWANLMAGLQFSYGNLDCVVQKENCVAYKAMLTHTPSRLGFPRPFLWDEGFHNIVACKSNPDICLQSLEDWVNTMSNDGWIPREQPRNDELRSYIHINEDPRESNPPTFFFNFEYLLRNPSQTTVDRIGKLYPKLKLWYSSWFKTQAVYEGDQFTGHMKWWGPDELNNLGSGLDDWPRSSGDLISKYNVDAQAWGYFFCKEMARLASHFDTEFVDELNNRKQLIQSKGKDVMLDKSDKLYKDILYDKNDKLKVNQYSPHRGYPNLIPLGLGMIDPADIDTISGYLQFMRDTNTIWTEYGLRSLEKNNEYFGKDSNYWRGPIWINIQYLILRGLKTYYWQIEGVQQFYAELRKNMITTVCSQYQSRGYFYEHYNQDLNGLGKGNRPFNGWTSLITMIIAEQY